MLTRGTGRVCGRHSQQTPHRHQKSNESLHGIHIAVISARVLDRYMEALTMIKSLLLSWVRGLQQHLVQEPVNWPLGSPKGWLFIFRGWHVRRPAVSSILSMVFHFALLGCLEFVHNQTPQGGCIFT